MVPSRGRNCVVMGALLAAVIVSAAVAGDLVKWAAAVGGQLQVAKSVVPPPENQQALTLEQQNALADAAAELKKFRLTEAEQQLRLQVIEMTMRSPVAFPDPDADPPVEDRRSADWWMLTDHGYVVAGGANDVVQAYRDLWTPPVEGEPPQGVFCAKLLSLILIKANIEFFNATSNIAGLTWLVNTVDANVSSDVIDLFQVRAEYYGARYPNGAPLDVLIPGDRVWFDNPYWKPEYEGNPDYAWQEGSNTIYIGNGLFMQLYGGSIWTLDDKQEGWLGWSSVKAAIAAGEDVDPSLFVIRIVSKPRVPRDNPY